MMDIAEYRIIEDKINNNHKLKLHRLRTEFLEANRKFNVGDFVYNVTGIIKVDKIGYTMFFNSIEITYSGLRYKKLNGELVRTKNNKKTTLSESHWLKKIIV